jgi:putative membrane protein
MEHLANERTFLSWIRTGVAFIGVGFVVARFGGPLAGNIPKGPLALGLATIGVGALLTLYAALEYKGTSVAIETGIFRPRTIILYAVSGATVILGAMAAAILFLT